MKRLMMSHLLPLLVILGFCCPAFAGQHPIVGKWSYTHQGKQYQREFTPDGKCRLTRADGAVVWTYPYRIVDFRTVNVRSSKTGKLLRHVIQRNGELNIENSYTARRVKPGLTVSSPSRLAPRTRFTRKCAKCTARCVGVDWLSGRKLPSFEENLGKGMSPSECVDLSGPACVKRGAHLVKANCSWK